MGHACRAMADRFQLAPSTIINWARRLRDTCGVAPAKFGGNLKQRLEAYRDLIRDQVEAVPHPTANWGMSATRRKTTR